MLEVFDAPVVATNHTLPFFSYTHGLPPGSTEEQELVDQGQVTFVEKYAAVGNWHFSVVTFTGFTLPFLGNPIVDFNQETPNFPLEESPFVGPTPLAVREQVKMWMDEIAKKYLHTHPQAKLLPLSGEPPEAPPLELQKKAYGLMMKATDPSGSRTTNVQNPHTPPPIPDGAKPAASSEPMALPPGAAKKQPKPPKGGAAPRVRPAGPPTDDDK